jgi:hypothetical protein
MDNFHSPYIGKIRHDDETGKFEIYCFTANGQKWIDISDRVQTFATQFSRGNVFSISTPYGTALFKVTAVLDDPSLEPNYNNIVVSLEGEVSGQYMEPDDDYTDTILELYLNPKPTTNKYMIDINRDGYLHEVQIHLD